MYIRYSDILDNASCTRYFLDLEKTCWIFLEKNYQILLHFVEHGVCVKIRNGSSKGFLKIISWNESCLVPKTGNSYADFKNGNIGTGTFSTNCIPKIVKKIGLHLQSVGYQNDFFFNLKSA